MSAPGTMPNLPSVTKVSNYVTRILGQNPGKFTLQGTNTYLIHHPASPSLILLDTAQGVPSFLPHLRSSIRSHPIQPCHLTDIILSHFHHDHVDGLVSVIQELGEMGAIAESGLKIWKYRCSGKEEEGKDRAIETSLERVEAIWIDSVATSPKESRLVEGGKIRALEDGQKFTIARTSSNERDRVELEVVHTPGHTNDSISILLRTANLDESEPPSTPVALFSFDTVLGHGTAVFSSLSTYLDSLTSLLSHLSPGPMSGPSPEASPIPIYPGHGPVIEDGASKLKEYREHRLQRERQVIEAMKLHAAEKMTAPCLTNSIYGSTISESLKPAACRGVILHLEKLESDGLVARHNPAEGTLVDSSLVVFRAGDVPAAWHDKWSWIGVD